MKIQLRDRSAVVDTVGLPTTTVSLGCGKLNVLKWVAILWNDGCSFVERWMFFEWESVEVSSEADSGTYYTLWMVVAMRRQWS